MTVLTQPGDGETEYEWRMTYTEWLRRQVARLEEEIRASSVFETDSPATPAELKALRSKVVIHTYLRQQLLRRGTVTVHEEEYDTQEFVIVRRA